MYSLSSSTGYYFEALTPECGRECLGTGDCGPARHVGAGRWRVLGLTAHGLLGRRHRAPASAAWLGEVGAGSIEITAFWGGGSGHAARLPRVWSFGAL